jgi:hypothetical protein
MSEVVVFYFLLLYDSTLSESRKTFDSQVSSSHVKEFWKCQSEIPLNFEEVVNGHSH